MSANSNESYDGDFQQPPLLAEMGYGILPTVNQQAPPQQLVPVIQQGGIATLCLPPGAAQKPPEVQQAFCAGMAYAAALMMPLSSSFFQVETPAEIQMPGTAFATTPTGLPTTIVEPQEQEEPQEPNDPKPEKRKPAKLKSAKDTSKDKVGQQEPHAKRKETKTTLQSPEEAGEEDCHLGGGNETTTTKKIRERRASKGDSESQPRKRPKAVSPHAAGFQEEPTASTQGAPGTAAKRSKKMSTPAKDTGKPTPAKKKVSMSKNPQESAGGTVSFKTDSDNSIQDADTRKSTKQGENKDKLTDIDKHVRIFSPPDDELEGGWPEGWTKEVHTRLGGESAGRKDNYWRPSPTSRKFRSMNEVKKYLAALKMP